jgi:hypothetical protein
MECQSIQIKKSSDICFYSKQSDYKIVNEFKICNNNHYAMHLALNPNDKS